MKVISETEVVSERADPDNFTGQVWRSEFVQRRRDDGMRAQRFFYEPGARSHWHIHTGEQVLVVVEGSGLLQWESTPARSLRPGDWVYVEPGVRHWHGAATESVFSHLAMTARGEVEWLGAVSEDEYKSASS
jgi:quercetin dioxygenase-like cupin family protein